MTKVKNTEPMEFDTVDLIEIPVTIAKKKYILREASGAAAAIYRNASMACFTLGPNGKPQKIQNMADVESLLVSSCLLEETSDIQTGGLRKVPVSQVTIKTWPDKMIRKLFERVKNISDLGDDELKLAIHKALKQDGSPVSIDTLRKWAEELVGEEYDRVRDLFSPTEEESTKN